MGGGNTVYVGLHFRWLMMPKRRDEELEKVKDQQESQRLADESYQKELERKCDWDLDEDRRLYLQDKRREKRMRILDKKVKNRKCPECGEMKLKSREWVISGDRSVVICRKCFYRYFEVVDRWKMKIRRREKQDPTNIRYDEYSLFKRIQQWFLIDIQIMKGIDNKSQFAKKAGWSRQYLYKLQSNTQWVSEETFIVIVETFRRFGKEVMDDIVLQEEKRIEVNREVFGHIEFYLSEVGFSKNEFLRSIGISNSYYHDIVRGRVKSIREDLAYKIVQVLKRMSVLLRFIKEETH